ncbi:AAA family ATPase [Vibrio marisflavi]|uniref:Chromosome partitioning protein ParA n=1 Tax=Vibrio marisflavi CECT 7928 TaxID=634439 RepID=A0ABM8ZYY6_9VIBR|nr:AAA family ATPase [Vibrio marisflavi]CAH0536159.1 hypothetical protein VMF7928_00249 [Vibrio marisflavi CECT 7928]
MTIPSTHTEIEQIYLAAELSGCQSLCITSCQSGDGVTSIATALTERYLLAGHKTLLVDLNIYNPSLEDLPLQKSSGDTNSTKWVSHAKTGLVFTGVTAPTTQSKTIAYRDPSHLSKVIRRWNEEYERVIVDTSPLLQINSRNIPAQTVASSCDKTLLVVKGGVTTNNQLQTAITLLQSGRVSLIGSILNLQDQPTLGQELVRQLKRISFLPKRYKKKLEHQILASSFLSQSA